VRKLIPFVALAALVLAPPASAKMCIRIATVPARPVAGAMTTIRVTTWNVVLVDGRLRRGNQPIPMSTGARLDVRVTSPGGVSRVVSVRRRDARRSVLEGRFVFPTSGLWKLEWDAFTPRNAAACAGATRVRVGGR
jgi:hypothetical protein